MRYPKIESMCKALRCRAEYVPAPDDARSPTRQSGRKNRGPGARAWALMKAGKKVSPAFWSKSNLERHCAVRWRKYLKTKPKGHG